MLTPNVVIQGLSRRIGPVGGLTDTSTYEQGTFDPHDFFDQNDAMLLGAIHLADIVDAGLSEPPTIISTPDGTQTTTQLHFEPVPKADGNPLGNFFVPDGDASTVVVDATVVTDLADPTGSTTTIDGELTAFTMHLLGDAGLDFIDLHFTQLRFHSETGQQSTVEPTIDDVTFRGVLEFINDLRRPDLHEDVPLSRIVLADILQLAPGRTAGVSWSPTSTDVTVNLTGPAYQATLPGFGPGKAKVTIEERKPGVPDADLGWAVVSTQSMQGQFDAEGGGSWHADLVLPALPTGGRFRLVIEQFDTFGPTPGLLDEIRDRPVHTDIINLAQPS